MNKKTSKKRYFLNLFKNEPRALFFICGDPAGTRSAHCIRYHAGACRFIEPLAPRLCPFKSLKTKRYKKKSLINSLNFLGDPAGTRTQNKALGGLRNILFYYEVRTLTSVLYHNFYNIVKFIAWSWKFFSLFSKMANFFSPIMLKKFRIFLSFVKFFCLAKICSQHLFAYSFSKQISQNFCNLIDKI